MEKKNNLCRGDPVLSILAGVFLLFYDIPLAFVAALMVVNGSLKELEISGLCLFAFVVLAVAVLLFCRKAKAAASLVTVAAVLVVLYFLPQILELLRGEIPEDPSSLLYTVFSSGQILAWTLLATALFLCGRLALPLTFLSAAAALASCLANFISFFVPGHAAGHPSPINVIPVMFAISVVCIGLWLRSVVRGSSRE